MHWWMLNECWGKIIRILVKFLSEQVAKPDMTKCYKWKRSREKHSTYMFHSREIFTLNQTCSEFELKTIHCRNCFWLKYVCRDLKEIIKNKPFNKNLFLEVIKWILHGWTFTYVQTHRRQICGCAFSSLSDWQSLWHHDDWWQISTTLANQTHTHTHKKFIHRIKHMVQNIIASDCIWIHAHASAD